MSAEPGPLRRLVRRAPKPAKVEHAEMAGGAPVLHHAQSPSVWPSFPPAGYLGQLEEAFQARLLQDREPLQREDCDFYHASVLRSGEMIPGAWDLRGGEDDYLGHTDFAGRRVFELGPASGHLTFFMEDRGADVVGVEPGFDLSIDLLPVPGSDMREERTAAMRAVAAVQNSWWFVHRDHESRAKVVYAPAYNLPGDIGLFDVSVFGAILLHLSNPFAAIAQAAARTHHRIVVTDLLQDDRLDPNANWMQFDPLGAQEHRTNWWSLSPGAITTMLKRVGFVNTTTSLHSQKHYLGHVLSAEPVDMPMFTVIGERSGG